MSGAANCAVLNQANEGIRIAQNKLVLLKYKISAWTIIISNKNNVHHLLYASWVI